MFTTNSRQAARARNSWLLGLGVLALLIAGCSIGASPQQGTSTLPPAPTVGSSSSSPVHLGQLVTARGIGTGNAPQNVSSTFKPSDTIYAVVQATGFPQGNSIFARWSVNGTPTEDSSALTADRNYTNTYVEFHIQGTGKTLQTGSWTVQLFVNGNPGPSTSFTIQ